MQFMRLVLLCLKQRDNVYPCVAKTPPVPKEMTGTLTLNMSKTPHTSTPLKFLQSSYSLATLEQEIYPGVVALAPDLQHVSVYSKRESRQHASTIKPLSPSKTY